MRVVFLILVLSVVGFSPAVRAQGTIGYSFNGIVTALNSGSTVFPGVGVGTPVEGHFLIDHHATDTSTSPTFGSYSSFHHGFHGTIGEHRFASLPGLNTINVDTLRSPPLPIDDFIVIQSGSGDAQVILTFYDPTGEAYSSEALPRSRSEFQAFPNLVLFARNEQGQFGQYTLHFTMVPEPSAIALLITAGAFVLFFGGGRSR